MRSVCVTCRMALSPAVLGDPDGSARAAWDDVLNRGVAVAGVQELSRWWIPCRCARGTTSWLLDGAARAGAEQKPLALATSVTPADLDVMGIALRRDDFRRPRSSGHAPVVVIDDVMAQRAFARQDPLGKQLWTDLAPEPLLVVGVVGHVRHWGLAADDARRCATSSTTRSPRFPTATCGGGRS